MTLVGRDRLGRLVYNWDIVKCGDVHANVCEPINPRFGAGFNCKFEFGGRRWSGYAPGATTEVDLIASFQRTNYERYFADLGTLDQVCEWVRECCKCTECCAGITWNTKLECDCPFFYWWQWSGNSRCPDGLIEWLKAPATQ